MMTDLLTLDPATVMPSAKLDALVATEWMRWKLNRTINKWGATEQYWVAADGTRVAKADWSPSTNAAHAGQARRKADEWELLGSADIIRCWLEVNGVEYVGACLLSDDEIKERAEALTTCRAILAALQVRVQGEA